MLGAGVASALRRVVTTLVVVAAAFALLLALLWLGQSRLIYLPDGHLLDRPADVSEVEAVTEDGVRHRAWVMPPMGDPVARVVVFNGNAGNRSHRLPLARSLSERGMEVVLFDYRGYGDTEGRPSEEGLGLDAAAVVEAVDGPDLPLVYFGESLGAAVATALATERPPTALVLRSPFTSLADVAAVHYPIVPARLLLRDRFEVESVLGQVEAPVLVVWGSTDSIVPARLSRRVYEAAGEPKREHEMSGLDHNDPDLGPGRELADTVAAFLADG